MTVELSKAQALKAAWEHGFIEYKLKPVQHKIYDDIEKLIAAPKSRKFVIHCSRRLGKSYMLCVFAINKALQKPNTKIRFISTTQKQTRDIVHPLIAEILLDCPQGLKPKYSAINGKYDFPNDSFIQVVGVNNGHEDDSRGTSTDYAIIDEAGYVDRLEYVVNSVLMPQLLTTNGILILSSSSPTTPAHPFCEFIQESILKETYSSYTIHDGDYAPERIQEFMDEAGGAESTTFRREYLNHLVSDSALQIVPEWNPEKFTGVAPRDEYFNFYHRYVSMDLGVRDMTALLFGYYDFKRAILYIEDELSFQGPTLTTLSLHGEIFGKERHLWGGLKPYMRISDSNEPVLLNVLAQDHNLSFIPVKKDLLNAMVNRVRLLVDSGRIVVDPRCKQLLGCLQFGIWHDKGKMFARSKAYGHFDHMSALIYMSQHLDLYTNPIPHNYGMHPERNFTFWSKKDKDSNNVLRSLFRRPGNK